MNQSSHLDDSFTDSQGAFDSNAAFAWVEFQEGQIQGQIEERLGYTQESIDSQAEIIDLTLAIQHFINDPNRVEEEFSCKLLSLSARKIMRVIEGQDQWTLEVQGVRINPLLYGNTEEYDLQALSMINLISAAPIYVEVTDTELGIALHVNGWRCDYAAGNTAEAIFHQKNYYYKFPLPPSDRPILTLEAN